MKRSAVLKDIKNILNTDISSYSLNRNSKNWILIKSKSIVICNMSYIYNLDIIKLSYYHLSFVTIYIDILILLL